MRYLLQAGHGQWSLSNRARPIAEVLRDERVPARTRDLLAEVTPLKAFAESKGIRPASNYTEYVALDRPAAVWVVSACERLRFRAKEWEFPIVGRFPYLGWFSRESAESFAADLSAEGWDVDLRPARAYSTLGWFRDAVLSSMIPEGPEALGELADIVIHESVHSTVYVKGQAPFNESLASFVAPELARDYVASAKGLGSSELQAYLKTRADEAARGRKLHAAYLELESVYASASEEAEKLERKGAVLARLKGELGGKRDLNNAALLQFRTYDTGRREFEDLLRACQGNWARMLERLRSVGPGSFSQPHQTDLIPVLQPLARAGC